MANMVTIESMKTVMPIKMTERKSVLVTVPKDHGTEIFQRRIHIVMYYKKVLEEESGWLVAGWMKESLGTALLDQPMLGGRLRRVEESGGSGGGGGDQMEIVSNDCGVRFLEAEIKIDLSEFLEAKGKDEEEETQLVFWEDIDELNPQFSPLCYVQVTNFECGGYAIGLSCSTLVIDPLTLTSFLKTWFNIHKTMISKSDIPKKPLFYLSNRRKSGEPISNVNRSIPNKTRSQTAIFKFSSSENLISGSETMKAVAANFMDAAERKFDRKTPSKLTLIIKESSMEIKTESFSRKDSGAEELSLNNSGAEELSLNDLGVEELSLSEGNKPVSVSYWISSESDEGLVMVIPSTDEGISGMDIIVTIPNDHNMI